MTEDPSTNLRGTGDRGKRVDLGGSDLRPLPWRAIAAVVIGAVLLGVVAAVASQGLPEQATEGGPAPLDITDPRVGEFAAWVIIVLAIAIVVFTFWPTGNRPRRLRRPPMSLRRFLFGMALLVFLMIIMRPILPEEAADPELEEEIAVEEAEETRGRPGWTLVLLAGALGAALGGIAVLSRRSIQRDGEEPLEFGRFPDPAAATDAQDVEPATSWGSEIEVDEPRRAAVVRGYGEMLQDLAASGHGRRESEAPEEYVRRIDAHTAAAQPARRLTRLFEIAGFSELPASDEMVANAATELDAVRRDLGRERR